MNFSRQVSDTLRMSLTARMFEGVQPTTPAPGLPHRRTYSSGGEVLRFRRVPAPDFDVVAMRSGVDVLVCVSTDHLTKRGVRSVNAALDHLAETDATDPLDEIC